MYYRLLKPDWGKPTLKGVPNPGFKELIDGPDTIEGEFSEEFVQQKNEQGYNCYYFPNFSTKGPQQSKYLNGRDIDVYNYCFVDMDLKDKVYESKEAFLEVIKAFPLQPTMVVDSGNGMHIYWALKDLNREQYIDLQFRLIQHFKTDDSIWTPLQLMRVPLTLNTKKYKDYKKVLINEDLSTGNEYECADLGQCLSNISPENKKKMNDHISKLDGTYQANVDTDVDTSKLPEKFLKLMEKNKFVKDLFEDPIGTYGDRSGADMKLCNILFSKEFTRKEAYQVMFQTLKARTHPNREDYASHSVDKVFSDRPKNAAKSIMERLKEGRSADNSPRVMGPAWLDATQRGWRRGEILGVVGGEGIGKTTMCLNICESFAINQPNDIIVYFSLEMSADEISEKWIELVGLESPLHDCIFPVGKEDDEGNTRRLGLQEMYAIIKDTEAKLNKKVIAFVVDHIGILSRVIDTNKKPAFDIVGNSEMGWNAEKTISLERLCDEMKTLAKMVDAFPIIQSQTSKDRAGEGDIPIKGNAAFGISNFGWICDHMISIWQPIRRVESETDIRVLAYQYLKIRRKGTEDKIKVYKYKLLNFELGTGRLSEFDESNRMEFGEMLKKANAIRAMEQKKQTMEHQYASAPNDPIPVTKLKLAVKRFDEGAKK